MDNKKKTIEQLAKDHASELRVSTAVPGALMPMLADIAESSYKCGVEDIMALPLSDRLTDDERKRLREIHNSSKEIVALEDNATMMYSLHTQIMIALESIFGESIFTETK